MKMRPPNSCPPLLTIACCTSAGIYTLVDGREVDVGVDWDEPLDVRARAVRRALRRKLGMDHFDRSDYPLLFI